MMGALGRMRALGRTWGMYIDNENDMKQAVRIVGAPRNACFWATVGVGKDVGDGRGTSNDIIVLCTQGDGLPLV
jgi:hypothetical protein